MLDNQNNFMIKFNSRICIPEDVKLEEENLDTSENLIEARLSNVNVYNYPSQDIDHVMSSPLLTRGKRHTWFSSVKYESSLPRQVSVWKKAEDYIMCSYIVPIKQERRQLDIR